jgi:hypothetical protein
MNTVEVVARSGGPYYVQSFEHGRWVQCPGEWVSLADAKHHAKTASGVYGPSTKFRVIPSTHIDRPRRVHEFVMRLKAKDLSRAGLIRLEDMVRSGADEELDRLWTPKSKSGRRVLERARAQAIASTPPRNLAPRVGLLRTLRLEFVGHDVWSIVHVRGMKPWVARPALRLSDLVGIDGRRRVEVEDRTFEVGQVDYAKADKTGGTGVELVFQLRQGVVYEVFDRARRVGPRRSFMIHDGQCWHDISREEAQRAQG